MLAAQRIGLTRRQTLGAAVGAALLMTRPPQPLAAGASAEAAIAKLLAGRSAVRSDRLRLTVPASFDYGNTIPLGIAIDSPMAEDDHVRRVDIFADGNPLPEVVSLRFAPGNGPAHASTRFRLDKGSHLIEAYAELSSGVVLMASSEITTASGGCSGESGITPATPEPEPVPRVNVPDHAGHGEIVEIPTMISHRMETGFRTDTAGNPLPRRIINSMECRYAGRTVFAAVLSPAIAANAYLKFPMRAVETGEVAFVWREDGGAVYQTSRRIVVG